MPHEILYLDTSVISALYDNRTPERQKLNTKSGYQAIEIIAPPEL
jgi:hypothetical protein